MELWEFNACIKAYNRKQQGEGQKEISLCWQTANFTGAAFGGKLKKLSHYLKDNQHESAPKISKEEFEKCLARAEGRDYVT